MVKTYGGDSLFGLLNPLLALMAQTFGFQLRPKSEDQVALEMERDLVGRRQIGFSPRPARLPLTIEIRLGARCWPRRTMLDQYADRRALLEAAVRADRLGFDSLWT